MFTFFTSSVTSTSATKISRYCLFITYLLCALLFSEIAFGAEINGVRVWRAPDNTRVVFDMTDTATYRVFALENPHRLVIDVDQFSSRFSVESSELANTPVKRIRSASRNKTDLRIVLDLSEAVKPRSFLLAPNKGKPHRLVVDLYDKATQTTKTYNSVSATKNSQPSTSSGSSPAQKNQRLRDQLRDILVVVDAGHGGEDPGAIGPKNLQEKKVVLDIAKRLAKYLNQKEGYKAVLTRTGDYFIPLRKRRDKARELRADLFVSVHADAFNNPQANGASVFALSQRGATSETARFLAKQENEADLIGGVGDVSLDDKDEVLRGVLVDLSMTATVGASLDVGKKVLGNMARVAPRLHKKHVEQAGFLVLKSPDVPSILIETGFISNPKEAKLLATASYRQKMADSIFTGIHRYFERSPPAGSYVAWKKNGGKASDLTVVQTTRTVTTTNTLSTPQVPVKTNKSVTNNIPTKSTAKDKVAADSSRQIIHTVQSGESLSVIGQRYRVSVAKIKKLNKLKKTTVRIGQQLIITDKKIEPVATKVTHTVKSGETLSEIAEQYKIPTSVLQRRNTLSSSEIRVGQVLTIAQ